MARIAVIGAGRMGYRFLDAIRASGNEIAMIFDPLETPFAVTSDPELARLHTRNLDDVVFGKADVTVICTTADAHVDLACKLVHAGKKRIIVEKPLSQSLSDAEDLQALARRTGARIIVNHGRRYCENTKTLKSLDSSPDMGSLRCIVIKIGGGSFGCTGTHWIDLCNNLFRQMPEKVFAVMSHKTPDNNRGSEFFDPGGTAILCYADGKRAIIDLGDDVGIVAGADFIFERGVVSWKTEGGEWSCLHRRSEDREKPLTFYGLPLVAGDFDSVPPSLIDYAVATIRDALSDEPATSEIDNAVQTMEVYAAVRWSASEGRPVTFPLEAEAKQQVYRIP
ncbi:MULTISPECIES: Gfo/Idh/MocA family oxidoreductase [unclassified Rhizobium]|uniref:Gfo/Idh/MocA family protein n=1 Tax=unclassified Rhizobium TaxID=2613769 RepID=UPI001AE54C1B|nr:MULTISPECIES: Gfo/Idh/MocA family oxidoreductase [unclassified Rhizobium]MBP2460152.1 putative dehydrogenase [Rhizobium sp. PvP014]MBP2531511.1 putative dehydrogenase [Rhizobium sp. PvP099]